MVIQIFLFVFYLTEAINAKAPRLKEALINKHFERKLFLLKNASSNQLDIELKNPIINIIFNKFFNYGFEKILNSFEQRARETIKY